MKCYESYFDELTVCVTCSVSIYCINVPSDITFHHYYTWATWPMDKDRHVWDVKSGVESLWQLSKSFASSVTTSQYV